MVAAPPPTLVAAPLQPRVLADVPSQQTQTQQQQQPQPEAGSHNFGII